MVINTVAGEPPLAVITEVIIIGPVCTFVLLKSVSLLSKDGRSDVFIVDLLEILSAVEMTGDEIEDDDSLDVVEEVLARTVPSKSDLKIDSNKDAFEELDNAAELEAVPVEKFPADINGVKLADELSSGLGRDEGMIPLVRPTVLDKKIVVFRKNDFDGSAVS